ncbi:iron complex outermembrane receptor protein [Pseudacidovorax sp. 1753]|uniref:TonB-dependent siderophore receptor n=1 Tax=Pseudacidovorax sp. 1753 TaxID=3156419 RepID=UPI003392A22F
MKNKLLLHPLTAALWALGLAVFPLAVRAQSGSATLPSVTVIGERNGYSAPESSTATRTDTPWIQIPQSTQVVPKAVIDDQSALTLSDALRNVSGVQFDFGFNGSMQPLVILRGFPSVSMTAMGAMSGSSTYYLDGTKVSGLPVNMANVQSVEVVKGPASVLYGRAEPGGLVNVVSKPISRVPQFSLEQTVGQYGLSRTAIEGSGPVNSDGTLLGRFGASYYSSDSVRDYVRDKLGAFTGTLSWVPDTRTSLSATLDYSEHRYRTDYGVPTNGDRPANLPWSRQFNDAPDLSNAKTAVFKVEGSHQIDDTWQVKAKALSARGTTAEVDVTPYRVDLGAGVSPLESCDGSGATLCRYYFNVRPDGRYKLDQFNVDLIGKFSTGSIQHTLLAGFDTYDSRKTGTMYFQQLSAVDVYAPVFGKTPKLDTTTAMPMDVQDRNRWTSFYLQDQLALGNGVFLTGALRHDRTSAIYSSDASVAPNDQSYTSPRVGAVWQFAANQAVYAQYQDSLATNNGRDTVTLAALQPEKARQFEVGHKAALFDGKLTSTVALFQLVKRNRAANVVIDQPPFYNLLTVGKARSRGLEWDVMGEITKKLSVIASYAYTDAEVTEDPTYQGKRLANVARHTGSIWARYAFDAQWSGGAGVFAQSSRAGDTANTFQLPGYGRVDAMLAYRFGWGASKASLQFNLDNVFNKKYYTGSHQFVQDWIKLGTPRTAKLTLRVDY